MQSKSFNLKKFDDVLNQMIVPNLQQAPLWDVDNRPMTKDRWETTVRCKKSLLDGDLDAVMTSEYPRAEIKKVWIESYKLGLRPSDKTHDPEEDMLRNENLMPFAQIVFPTIHDLGDFNKIPIFMNIHDRQGTFFFQKTESGIESYFVQEFLFSNEPREIRKSGLTSHLLCKRSMCPAVLLGPEHYLESDLNINSASAPIFDVSGNLDAIITLAYRETGIPWEKDAAEKVSTILTQVLLLAHRIQTSIRPPAERDIPVGREEIPCPDLINDPPIIVVDPAGTIIGINPAGRRFFPTLPTDGQAGNIRRYLPANSKLLPLIQTQAQTIITEVICSPPATGLYSVQIRPFEAAGRSCSILLFSNAKESGQATAPGKCSPAADCFNSLIGESHAFRNAIDQAVCFANSNGNILLTGESGTGKELFAKAIHNCQDKKGPFVAINCAAIPRELISSELFGYASGSFTGGDRKGRKGKIEMADGGTLFLDEIGDMPYELQAVLLRVLQDKQVTRIGDHVSHQIEFNLITATNRNLKDLMESGQFRPDLFYRISMFPINIPPLRDRKGDIKLLVSYFMNSCGQNNPESLSISNEALQILEEYDWPGNVRQLENVILYMMTIAKSRNCKVLLPEHIPNIVIQSSPPSLAPGEAPDTEKADAYGTIHHVEKVMLEKMLKEFNHDIPLVAEILGVSKSTVYRKIKRYNLA
ncbi:Anaerobic nitric oxide reductase transcription regulator NorR [bioreactor metagenome]|uniref:Limonene hydroxylase n=2 Tax=root TaxID=1 RepID=A0A098AY77_DESHA|nr:sigma 54-interacting transcriptional regulator [Desulfitobacterium hafniense]MEA5024144.1 sigma 54-interacting transcriptional regulator [Desulfitobacterium hafniense]CDX00566.1 Limonene hydroxylase [Desulfitobacterium hafniense]